LAERTATATTCATYGESSPQGLTHGLSDNLVSILKMEHYENQHHEDSKALLTRPSGLHMNHQGAMDHEDHTNHHDARTPRQKGKFFDGYYMNYPEFHFPETVGDIQGNEIGEYPNNIHLSNEFDPFSDMMTALQPRLPKNEEAFHDSGAFFYPRGFNSVYNFEEKMGKAENGVGYEDNAENCTLKSFMDTQKLLQEALKKSTFWNCNGNQGFRKSSFDLF